MLLTANVGLLAIQSVDTGKADRSLAQISSYISTFLSLGNIILCTILARQHRLDAHMTAEAAVRLARQCDIRATLITRPPSQSEYLARRLCIKWGMEILAVIFSLPSALFLWGYVCSTQRQWFMRYLTSALGCWHSTSQSLGSVWREQALGLACQADCPSLW